MKISIITVCYNSASTIVDTINSVASQAYANIEHIIVDGGSSDATMEIVQSSPSVSKFISEPDKGIYDAMNKGIKLATGDVVGILNSDDFYTNTDVITQVVKTFEANPDAQILLGNVDFVKSDNVTMPVRFYSSFSFAPWKMRFGFMPAHPATFVKPTAYEMVGYYKLGYKIGADFEWFVRGLVLQRLTFVKLNQTLVRMREGGVSTSGFKSYFESSKDQLRALSENGIYSNFLFVFVRLPIKFMQKLFRKS